MVNGYQDNLSIDRKDSKGNYEPTNCRWSNHFTQNANRSIPKNNTSGYKGVNTPYGRQKNFTAIIVVKKKKIYIGSAPTARDTAILYNNYIEENNLPHTKNIIGESNEK